jgi:hypothetical protein
MLISCAHKSNAAANPRRSVTPPAAIVDAYEVILGLTFKERS